MLVYAIYCNYNQTANITITNFGRYQQNPTRKSTTESDGNSRDVSYHIRMHDLYTIDTSSHQGWELKKPKQAN